MKDLSNGVTLTGAKQPGLQSPLSGRAPAQGGAFFSNLLFLYRKTVRSTQKKIWGYKKLQGERQNGYKGR